jgi:hypothetical protein
MLPSAAPPAAESQWAKETFVALSNPLHPGNRIGYRFLEHLPIAFGAIPESGAVESISAEAERREKTFAAREGVFLKSIGVKEQGWAPQTWRLYFAPRQDGFDLLWVVETKDQGLNEFYSAQQCFRLTGRTNKGWRRNICEAPTFSEYDWWAAEQAGGKSRSSLSFVRRGGAWAALPAVEGHVACRTPMGRAMDAVRSGGEVSKITGLPPYGPTRFEPDADNGLAVRTSADGQWVCGLYWDRATHIANHHPADCLHLFVNLGPLPPHSKRAIRGRVYWLAGSKEEVLRQWEEEF